MTLRLTVLFAGLLLIPLAANAQSTSQRFPQLKPEAMTEAQRDVAARLPAVDGLFNVMLRSPILADRIQHLGDYVRVQTSLPKRLNEFAILVVARHWTAQYEWNGHYGAALKAGVAESTAADLAQGRRPTVLPADEAAVYDFCTELQRTHAVTDATFARAKELLGEQQVVDLIGVVGAYTMVAMMIDVADIKLPPGVKTPLAILGP